MLFRVLLVAPVLLLMLWTPKMVKFFRVSLKGYEVTPSSPRNKLATLKLLTTVDDSGAHFEERSCLMFVTLQTLLLRRFWLSCMSLQLPCAYAEIRAQGQLLDSIGKVCSNVTSVDGVIVMSHARRWLLQCCASESEERWPTCLDVVDFFP